MPQLSSEPLRSYDFGPAPKRRVEVYRGDTLIFAYGGQPPDVAEDAPSAAVSASEDEQADRQQG